MVNITTVLLIKETALTNVLIDQYYIEPLIKEGILKSEVLVLPLLYNTPTKILAKTGKAYLDKLISCIPNTVESLIIADSSYFKFITKVPKVSSKHGTTVLGQYPGYERFTCVYVPNYTSLFKQPANQQLIDIGIKCIAGTNSEVILFNPQYAKACGEDRELLDSLHQYDTLSVDIETTGLTLDDKIVSIAFAWSTREGIAINIRETGHYYTRKFLEEYRGKFIFHNALFDIKLLVRDWWMNHETDYINMIFGLHHFIRCHDTMLLAYLATNSTTQISLKLKDIALEYLGNYAIELDDIIKYTQDEVLEYNLYDAVGTIWIWEKYQSEINSLIYLQIFQPSIYPLVKMMLVGLPMDADRVREVHNILAAKTKVVSEQIQLNPIVQGFNRILRAEAWVAANEKLKKTTKDLDKFDDIQFNPGSHQQLSKLLFEEMGLPILDKTKSGAPATGADVLKDLSNHTDNVSILELLRQVQELSEVTKINGTFIKAFLQEEHFLHGSLKLGGTQSGRLSCLVANSMVLSSEGFVRISDLTLSHIVQTVGGLYKPIINIWDNGTAPVFEITLKNGMQVTGTSNHRFLTEDGYQSLETIYGKDPFNRPTSLYPRGSTIVEYSSAVAGTRYSYPHAHQSDQSTCSTAKAYRGKRTQRTCNCSLSRETITKDTTVNATDLRNVQESSIIGTRGYGSKAAGSVHTRTANNSRTLYSRGDNIQGGAIQKQSQRDSLLAIPRPDGRDPQASSLYSRWERLLTHVKALLGNWKSRKQAHICTSSSDDGEFTNYLHTCRICGASCEWGQNRQPNWQLSPSHKRSSFKTASGYSDIQRVNFVGTKRVYDVEVETDHCYLVNGIWSHNSNSPNLTNLPSHGPMGKATKSCIVAPDGWLFAGADYSALEERIGAILSKDPNRIKVYTDGYDGHSMRAQKYFEEQMPDIAAQLKAAETATKFWIDDKGEYQCE